MSRFLLVEFEGRDEEGRIVDSTKGEIAVSLHGREGPFLVVPGKIKLIKGLMEALRGMKEGEEKEVVVPPEKGYGEWKKEKVLRFPRILFTEQIEEGDEVEFPMLNGIGVVYDVGREHVSVDFNHPLAGKTVKYRIKVVKVLKDDKEKLEWLLDHFDIHWLTSEEDEDDTMLCIRISNKKAAKLAMDVIKKICTEYGLDFDRMYKMAPIYVPPEPIDEE